MILRRDSYQLPIDSVSKEVSAASQNLLAEGRAGQFHGKVGGAVAFVDHNWSRKFSSSFGGSMVNIWNSDAESPSDFHQGYYALTNLLYSPIKNVMAGGEFEYGRRVNFQNGYNFNDYRVQFSFKYSYAKTLSF